MSLEFDGQSDHEAEEALAEKEKEKSQHVFLICLESEKLALFVFTVTFGQ